MTYRRKGIFERGSCLSATVLFMVVFVLWPGPARGVQQVTGESVTLAWDRSEGATGYMVLYAPYPQGDPVERLDVGNQTEVTLDVWEGAAFYVAVQAYNENAASDLSDVLTFVVGGEKQSPINTPDGTWFKSAGLEITFTAPPSERP